MARQGLRYLAEGRQSKKPGRQLPSFEWTDDSPFVWQGQQSPQPRCGAQHNRRDSSPRQALPSTSRHKTPDASNRTQRGAHPPAGTGTPPRCRRHPDLARRSTQTHSPPSHSTEPSINGRAGHPARRTHCDAYDRACAARLSSHNQLGRRGPTAPEPPYNLANTSNGRNHHAPVLYPLRQASE